MTRFVQREYPIDAMHNLERQGYALPLARALASRGIRDKSDLDPSWSGLLSPDRLEGTRQASIRLKEARDRGEWITIVGDYDCDGATATTVALKGLTALGCKVNFFIPDRVAHGYGLSPTVVEIIKSQYPECSLIVTVDNGVAAIKAVECANQLGMDVIITDHHLPAQELPAAYAIVNPNLKESQFPSKHLAGVGVMFYLLLAFRAYLRECGDLTTQTQPNLNALIDLVALGTVADVVKLDKNNRILVSQGLSRIRSGKASPGIAALFQIANKPMSQACPRDFGFALAPRINAAGRIASMESGIECLRALDYDQALHWAQNLDSMNSERQEIQAEMQAEAKAELERLLHQTDGETLTVTLFHEAFNEGIVGLVASRMKDQVHRPVIAFAKSEAGLLKGSGRSIKGIHLRDTLDLIDKALPGAMVRFGGHAMAAGLTLRPECLEAFKATFEEVVRNHVNPEVFERVQYTDGGLAPDELTLSLVDQIEAQIWGQDFETPVFANQFEIVRQTVLKEQHLRLHLRLNDHDVDAIYFGQKDPLPSPIKLAYRPQRNVWRGHESLQLQILAHDTDELMEP